MINLGKFPVLGVNVCAVDMDYAADKIIRCAQEKTSLSVTALAVHGIMSGFYDHIHRRRLNGIDLVLPDGRPVYWALKWLHHISLPGNIRGSDLILKIAEKAAYQSLPIYLYGSTKDCLQSIVQKFKHIFPQLIIAGIEPSKFRKISKNEKLEVIRRINESRARIVFIGLGCPRQEVWIYEYQYYLKIPLIAVGAAFSFHAGILKQAPEWMQRIGLEWFYRLVQEPRRLWKRYLILNPTYLSNVLLEAFGVRKTAILMPDGTELEESYG
jgi:exopolysaccharide biosynthesis WecB/TagA/CpsF family protein